MSTKVIKKYLAEGVLNYVDHETPRHYFLYDGVMEEQNADVHRLVEDLCDENMELQKRIKELENERDDYAFKLAEANNTYSEMHVTLSEANDKLAKAQEVLQAFKDFDDLPVQAKRPDVFELKVRQKLLRALAELKGDN